MKRYFFCISRDIKSCPSPLTAELRQLYSRKRCVYAKSGNTLCDEILIVSPSDKLCS